MHCKVNISCVTGSILVRSYNLFIMSWLKLYIYFQITTKYVNGKAIREWDIIASNGVIHVIEASLKAPPATYVSALHIEMYFFEWSGFQKTMNECFFWKQA